MSVPGVGSPRLFSFGHGGSDVGTGVRYVAGGGHRFGGF